MTCIDHLDTGGIRIEYSLSGPPNRPTIAFVHGFSLNLKQFVEQERYFRDEYQVLLFSMRGHGGSGCPESACKDSFSLGSMAEDVVTLLDLLQLPAVHWVGNSMGGLLGYHMLRGHPEKLLSLATFGITAHQHYGPFFERVAGLSMNLATSLNLISVLGKLGGSIVSNKRETREKVTEMAQQASKPALRYAHFNVYSFNYLDELAEAQIPVLLIHCEYDKAMNKVLGSTIRVLQKSAKGTVVEMSGVGHFANMDNPDRFNEILNSWYQRIYRENADMMG